MSKAILNELTTLIGEEAPALIVKYFGGTEIHIPQRPRDGSQLVAVLGLGRAEKLCAYMGGTVLHVPVRPTDKEVNTLAIRNREIFDRWKRGDKRADIARDYGLTTRMIRYIVTDF